MEVSCSHCGRPVTHGKRSTYTKHKCRCLRCREANAEYKRNKTAHYRSLQAPEDRKVYRTGSSGILGEITHGLPSSYEWYGCRCEECTASEARTVSSRKIIRELAS